eukprot:14050293-Alexandrium_andersonii.AAC.1
MENIQAVWTEAEMCSALKDNEDKRVRWRCRLRGNTLVLEGDSTKALGVVLPVPCMRVSEAYEAKLEKSIYEARSAAGHPPHILEAPPPGRGRGCYLRPCVGLSSQADAKAWPEAF